MLTLAGSAVAMAGLLQMTGQAAALENGGVTLGLDIPPQKTPKKQVFQTQP